MNDQHSTLFMQQTVQTSSKTFMSLLPKPLAATTTSNLKVNSEESSVAIVLNRGYKELSYRKRRLKNVRMHSTSRLKYLGDEISENSITKGIDSDHSAFTCDVLTI